MKTEQIISKMQRVAINRDKWNKTQNEGATDGYNPHDDQLDELSETLNKAMRAESPLNRDLQGEREWFNSQRFSDLGAAANACLARGYSLADLQSAAKGAR